MNHRPSPGRPPTRWTAPGGWVVQTAVIDQSTLWEELIVTLHGYVQARIIAHRDPRNPDLMDAATVAALARVLPDLTQLRPDDPAT